MPVNRQLAASLRNRLSSYESVSSDSFKIASDLCRLVSEDPEAAESHDLVLRAMEYRDEFGPAIAILDGLLRQIGLFPYLDPAKLSLADLLAYEAHRPEQMGDQIVFHRAQAYVYQLLMAGTNVALSAPTSFGKSLVIDAMIASGKYKNIVIVVPTLALIDETRRRLTGRFRGAYKIITRPSQARSDRNVFILTQERVLDGADWSFVDFFVIDEFYKLSPQRDDDDRSAILNQAFYTLAKSGAQFYMLGPNISAITDQNHLRIRFQFVKEPDYHTVATQVHRLQFREDEFDSLIALCRELDDPTIIFCSSPNRASEVARRLVSAGIGTETPRLQAASDWIANHYHPEWHFRKALARGIGVHHGRVPRSLGQFVVRRFNEGDVQFLACTSTLIEGVNTKARNIVLFDNTIDGDEIDLFTFNNIKGRSGRMFQYYVGHVYVFRNDPQTELPFIDVPALSQSTAASDSLIVQMDEDDLTDDSRERRKKFVEQDVLSFEVIQQNRGIDPERQLTVARRIANESAVFKGRLVWSGVPQYRQLRQVCDLIYDEFGGARLGSGAVRSASQLTYWIWNLRDRPTIKELVQGQVNNRAYPTTPDEAVRQVLDFIRMWATFHFPRLLRALSNIQRDVLSRQGLRFGSYEWYASQVECLFFDPAVIMMDEFGIPLDVARRLQSAIAADGDLDLAIDRLQRLDLNRWQLSAFERELVEDARLHL